MSDWDDDNSNDSAGIADLRKHLKKLEAELKAEREAKAALEEQTQKLSKDLSAKSLTDLTNGLPANLTKYLKKDFGDGRDVTKENVDKWLAENGEDFGYKPGETQAEKPAEQTQDQNVFDALDQSERDELLLTQGLDAGKGAGSLPSGDLMSRLQSMSTEGKTESQLLQELRDLGAPIVRYGS